MDYPEFAAKASSRILDIVVGDRSGRNSWRVYDNLKRLIVQGKVKGRRPRGRAKPHTEDRQRWRQINLHRHDVNAFES